MISLDRSKCLLSSEYLDLYFRLIVGEWQPLSLATRFRAINSDLTLSSFLAEHTIIKNHKPTATPLLTVIAVAKNQSLSPLASLALVPSPPPSIPSLSSTFTNRGGNCDRDY